MGTVLGLSLTPSRVGWVMLGGSSVDSETLDHDICDVGSGSDDGDLARYLAAVRGVQAIAATGGQDLTTVGVTWTDGAAAVASLLLEALPDLGFEKVVSVRLAAADTSNGALSALARSAALGVYSNVETVPIRLPATMPTRTQMRTPSKWRTSARAAAALAAGVTVLFVVGPEFAGQQRFRSTQTQPEAPSLGFQAVTAPAAAASTPDVVQLVAGRPKPAPTRRSSPAIETPVVQAQQIPVVTLSTENSIEAAPEHALTPTLPGPAPLPVANPAQLPGVQPAGLPAPPPTDPAQAVVNPLFSALP